MDVLPLPLLPSDVPCAPLGTVNVSRSSCSALALHPNQTNGTGSQVLLRERVAVPRTKIPNPPALGSQVIGRALCSKARAAGASLAAPTPCSIQQWGNRWRNQELKQQSVYNPINVIIHYLITEIVSHCSGRSEKTNSLVPARLCSWAMPETGFWWKQYYLVR